MIIKTNSEIVKCFCEKDSENIRIMSSTDKIPNIDENKGLLDPSQNSNNIHIIKSSPTKDAEGKKWFFLSLIYIK